MNHTFNFSDWHESLSGFTSGAWVDEPTAKVLQHWHDHALGIWVKAGQPTLPVAPAASAADDPSLPAFATWLLGNGPATGQWFVEQCMHADNAELNMQLDYAFAFWQCCAMFTDTLNAAWAFV